MQVNGIKKLIDIPEYKIAKVALGKNEISTAARCKKHER